MTQWNNKLAFFRSTLSPSCVGFLIFFVTNRCNFNCPFCFYREEIEKGKKEQELSLEEITQFAKKAGPIAQISLTGGEPFLRKDFTEVAKVMTTHCQPTYLTIPTNGSLTDRMTKFLREFLPRFPDTYVRLVLSIDGIGQEHDTIRATPGAYKKLMASYEAISSLREEFNNLILDANACFSASNQDTLRQTLETLHEDFNFDNLSLTYARGKIKDPSLKQVTNQIYIDLNDYLESLPRGKESRFLYPVWRGIRDVSRDHLIRTVFHEEFITTCVAGRKMIVIKETGDVEPCEILDKPLGNLRDHDYDLYSVLASKTSRSIRQWIKDSRCKCSHECALTANVAWSPGSYPQLLLATLKNIGKGAK
ncbi:MAG: radical SAM protein [Pseudodesulfovibrio sp.]